MTKRFAAIDVGSNTIKVNIADSLSPGKFQKILYKDFPSCLGHNLVNNIVDSSALSGCYSALKEIKKMLNENKVDEFKCIATHALRVAVNKEEVGNLIKANTGFEIEVVSGEEEARLTLMAVMIDKKKEQSFVCINGGGGSTELGFHFLKGDKFIFFDFGAINLYNDFIKGQKDVDSAMDEIRKFISGEFKKKINFSFTAIEEVIALGGSIFNAGYIFKQDDSRNFEQLANLKLSLKDIASIINKLKTLTEKEHRKFPGIDPKHLNTILPGILVHYFLVKLLNKNELFISTRTLSDALISRMTAEK